VILSEDDDQRWRYLTNYRITYLERDIRSLTQVGSLEDFARVLDTILLQVANLIDKTKIAREAGISHNTVRKYISILEQTFVLEQLRPYTGSLRRRMVKTPKVFFFDNGFSTVVNQIDTLTRLKMSGRIGAAYENLCLNEMIKTVTNTMSPPDIFFWRTVGGAEVDFVLKRGELLLPLEVKYAAEASPGMVKGLRHFKQAYPGRVDRLLVIYTGPLRIEGDTIFLPLWMI
jgi:predicted AAA+ superfamily ATPase